jgi:hypothetical protein
VWTEIKFSGYIKAIKKLVEICSPRILSREEHADDKGLSALLFAKQAKRTE